MPASHDAVVIGGGHNGLVAATLLGRAGRSVIVLERREQVGGAAISGSPFPGVNVRASRFSYPVSLFPAALLRPLGVGVELRRRRIAPYAPIVDSGLTGGARPGRDAGFVGPGGDRSARARCLGAVRRPH
jgi:phytoene dehydrogenase-like protein